MLSIKIMANMNSKPPLFGYKQLTIYNLKVSSSRPAVNLAYKIHGPKPPTNEVPILVMHGLLGSKRNWESMCKNISSGSKKSVVAVDVRNHGESPHNSSHTYPELASDISLLMNTLSISKAILIGHSMGGRTAMVLALTEPSKIASLVVADISPVSTAGILNDFFPRLIDVMKSVDFKGVDNLAKARKIASDTILASGLIDNAQGMRFILMNIGTKPDKTIGWMCNVDALKAHFMGIASFPPEMKGKVYPGPTLFIGGDQSNYIPPSDIDGIRELFPKAELKYIPGVGHNVHAEDPATFLKMVLDFLSQN